jgi:hypothetical protein
VEREFAIGEQIDRWDEMCRRTVGAAVA